MPQPPPRETRETRTRSSARSAENPEPRAPSALAKVTGTFMQPAQVNERLQFAAEQLNLVSPATAVGALPEGCGIALNAVVVNTQHETYNVGTKSQPKLALSKSALDRVAASMGVSWIPEECVRVDDGSDPHYVHFRVAGKYRAFDGQVQTITANKEMDLRDGSPAIVQIEAEVDKHNQNPQNKWKRDKVSQIRQLRSKILEHAETKAKLRAVRSLGVRGSYTPQELQKPFICARIMFTGQTQDPELKKLFAEKTADAFLAGTHTLYGGSHAPIHPSRQLAAEAHSPPPLGSGGPLDIEDLPSDEGGEDEPIDTEGESTAAAAVSGEEFTIPGGRNKGTALHDASDADLSYWAERIGSELDAGRSRDPERDTALHHALCEEIAVREHDARHDPNTPGPRQQELKT